MFAIKRLSVKDGVYDDLTSELSASLLLSESPLFPTVGVKYGEFTIDLITQRRESIDSIDESDREELFPILYGNMMTALALLESVGMCHLDIKPENILVKYDMERPIFQLTGFSKVELPTAELPLISHDVIDLPYRPPELLLSGFISVSEMFAADLWSMGMVLKRFVDPSPLPTTKEELVRHLHATVRPDLPYDEFTQCIVNRSCTGRLPSRMAGALLSLSPKNRPKASSVLVVAPMLKLRQYPRRVSKPLLTALMKLLNETESSVKVVAVEIATRLCARVNDCDLPEIETTAMAICKLAHTFKTQWIDNVDTLEVELFIMKELVVIFNPQIVPVINRAVEKEIDPLSVPLTEFERPLVEWFT